MTSRERVRTLLNGSLPDRTPYFDLVRNDAVIEYFTGERLTVENAPRLVYRAVSLICDGTRPAVRLPQHEGTEVLPDGRTVRRFRWTTWTDKVRYADAEAFAAMLRHAMQAPVAWSEADEQAAQEVVRTHLDLEERLGDVLLLWGHVGGEPLSGICHHVGLEQFSYYLADCPDVIAAYLEHAYERAVERVRHFPFPPHVCGIFLGSDIALKTGPMFRPEYLRRHYFPGLKRIVEAYHERGIKVIYHSDGNLMPILDDLAACGIDGLNPIEVCSGMDIREIHRRYPHLILVGGIDVSQLLPFGTPQEVRDAVVRAIEDAEGRIMIGSSTELQYTVPLANFLAMWETARNYSYHSSSAVGLGEREGEATVLQERNGASSSQAPTPPESGPS